MRLRQLHLWHYRLHQELALEFASGLTVLQGRNESGRAPLWPFTVHYLCLPVAVVPSSRACALASKS